ncbi:MAG: hypothetical protein ABWY25_04905 [Paenisporosarcina sp.]
MIFRKLFEERQKKPLEVQIDAVYRKMEVTEVDSPEFDTLLKGLERLIALKEKERPKRVSRDTVWQVLGSIGGILVIVIYENRHVITTRGFNWIRLPNK